MIYTNNDWQNIMYEEAMKPYFQELKAFLDYEYSTQSVYPPRNEVYNALVLTPFASTRVVILGQDPYIRKGQAHGMAFSVNQGSAPSLRNIFKELHTDIGAEVPPTSRLDSWAKQGVLLLNSVLTVREGESGSHAGKGWEGFTDCIIEKLAEKQDPVVFLLWGKYAHAKARIIKKHQGNLVLESAHPSPLARGKFLGSRPFSQANAFLEANCFKPIDWKL